MKRIRRFFFPPPEKSRLRRYLPWAIVIFIPIGIALSIPAGWEYSNSPSFCGKTCHTMPPEYNTYLVSPHARIPCVDCHIGRGSVYQKFIRKTDHIDLLIATIRHSYELPIRISEMRPARETCELCHFPEKFSDDSLREVRRFQDDEANTPYSLYLLMHTGGGSQREGLGQGIHWHIENTVEYIATDKEEQDIPWIRVTKGDGTESTYVAQNATIDTSNLGQYNIKEMDCITCHNRISHLIANPRDVVDEALYQGDISSDIPYIRRTAVEVLTKEYDSKSDAKEQIPAQIDAYYSQNYPDFYAANSDALHQASATLVDLWDNNNYPEQELTWDTHPDNIGHRDSPGCFRCHDGQHLDNDGTAIRLECNLCHSIPLVVRASEIEPQLPLTTGIEPTSHLDSTWMMFHSTELDQTCTNCHTIENAGGTTDTSFCSNSGCHGVDWRYAGFNAPALAAEQGFNQNQTEEDQAAAIEQLASEDLTYQTLQPMFVNVCGTCHGAEPAKGLRLIDYAGIMAGSIDGPVIVPGSPDDSKIMEIVQGKHFAQLTNEEIGLLREWISLGAPEGEPQTSANIGDVGAEEQAQEQPVIYEDVAPFLTATCGRCHTGATPPKGLNLTTYETIIAGAEDGPVVNPGSPDDSKIIQILEAGHFAKLEDNQMALLRQWIADGALETVPAPSESTQPAATEEAAVATQEAAATGQQPVLYEEVSPFLTQTCGRCHAGETAPKGLDMTSYDTILAGAEDGPVVRPHNPDDSKILQILEAGHFAKLDDDQMALLRQWITDGALETVPASSESTQLAATEEPTATEEPAATEAAASEQPLVTYADVGSFLRTTCGRCHAGETAPKGLDMTSYDTILAGAEDGPVVRPRNPDESRILQILEAGHFAKLDDDQMTLLRQWIADGALEKTP